MDDIRYYPVVDCDASGSEKISLCGSTRRRTISENHTMWLEEIFPYYFRLYVRGGSEDRAKGSYKVHCPYCNKALTPVTKKADKNKLELYVCSSCNNKSKGGYHNGNKRIHR